MTRQCMRPGCDRPVAACLTYDTEAVAVWLDVPVTDGQPAQQVCANHASSLTAPIGWTITDRRPVLPQPEPAPTTASESEQERVPVQDPVPEKPVERDPEPVADTDVEGATELQEDEKSDDEVPREPAAAAESPRSLGPRGKPRGKLLDRAFEWTGPQHSVLTTGDQPGTGEQASGSED